MALKPLDPPEGGLAPCPHCGGNIAKQICGVLHLATDDLVLKLTAAVRTLELIRDGAAITPVSPRALARDFLAREELPCAVCGSLHVPDARHALSAAESPSGQHDLYFDSCSEGGIIRCTKCTLYMCSPPWTLERVRRETVCEPRVLDPQRCQSVWERIWQCLKKPGHCGPHLYPMDENRREGETPEAHLERLKSRERDSEHDWDYETKTCRKCGRVAERLQVDINWPHKVSEF